MMTEADHPNIGELLAADERSPLLSEPPLPKKHSRKSGRLLRLKIRELARDERCYTNQRIAGILGVNVGTVVYHLRGCRQKNRSRDHIHYSPPPPSKKSFRTSENGERSPQKNNDVININVNNVHDVDLGALAVDLYRCYRSVKKVADIVERSPTWVLKQVREAGIETRAGRRKQSTDWRALVRLRIPQDIVWEDDLARQFYCNADISHLGGNDGYATLVLDRSIFSSLLYAFGRGKWPEWLKADFTLGECRLCGVVVEMAGDLCNRCAGISASDGNEDPQPSRQGATCFPVEQPLEVDTSPSVAGRKQKMEVV